MKTSGRQGWACGIVFLLAVGAAHGAAPGGAGPRPGLLESTDLNRLSIGADLEYFRRRVTLKNGPDVDLDAKRVSGMIGWDAAPWLTVFGTGGGIESRLAAADYGSAERRWSAGLHARFWHIDIRDPAFMDGRLSVDATLERSRSTLDDGWVEGRWNETYASLTAAYELFVESIEETRRVPFSLRLFVGPIFSRIDGKVRAGGVSRDFEEAKDMGVCGGAELFVSHNLSVGFNVQRFERTTSLGTLRYRF